ncbi:hypothetical protein F751_0311 [Auxenochlorella protothecoides]|uniref:RRM domain-containing protein n=1 Tax=Auxenochlorella protothecoides TaxID=3075 RepID=A0A087SS66_AUXPR|nr:hypothetical protein F751_0311 [Auxenochlorella protothecoides]KFM28570.1 hypothetical protein F751_0311 [Auxenochlorella protothecoides]
MAYYHRPNGHHLRRVSPPPAEQPCKLFLFNLAKCVTDSDLRPLFAPFKPQYAKVALGKKGQSRRFGFALFETQDQADAAQSALQRRLPTPKSRYLASDRSGNAYCPNTRKPPMVMDVSDMSQPRRPAHQDDQENLEWRSKADRLPAYEQRSRLSLMPRAPHAFGQVLSGALVRVLDHGRYRLRIVDEVTFDARGKIVLVLNFVLAGTVSNTNCLQSDDCGKEELAELISSLHSLGRTITVHDMAATMWRLSAARAWWDVMTINGMLSVDAVDRLPELVALLNQHDGPHTCYDLVEAAGVAHGVQDSHQGENTWKEEPSASGPSRDSGPTPDSASDPGSKASLTPKPSDMAPVPRQLFGSPKHGLVGTEVSSPFHGPTLTPA